MCEVLKIPYRFHDVSANLSDLPMQPHMVTLIARSNCSRNQSTSNKRIAAWLEAWKDVGAHVRIDARRFHFRFLQKNGIFAD